MSFNRLKSTYHILSTSIRPVPISPLKLDTLEERDLFAKGEKNYQAKKAMSKTTLRKETPNDEESDLVHAMWLRQLDYHGQWLTIQLMYIGCP